MDAPVVGGRTASGQGSESPRSGGGSGNGQGAVGGSAGQHGVRVMAVVMEVAGTVGAEPVIGWWQRW